jgi:hypothetical protein
VPDREPADRSELEPAQAEQLLDGLEAIDDDAPLSLAALLAAARAAGRPDELRGEDTAVAAFHSARFVVTPPRPAPPSWARVLTAKAIALAFLIALASVGLAAGVRVVIEPTSSQNPDGPVRAVTTNPAPIAPPNQLTTTAAQSSSSPSPAATPTPTPTASPVDLIGLCESFRKRDHPHPEDSGGGSPYSALIAAAGGSDKVAAFCAHLEAGSANHPTHTPATAGATNDSPTPSTGASPLPTTNGG